MSKDISPSDISPSTLEAINELYEKSVRSVIRDNREQWIRIISDRLREAISVSAPEGAMGGAEVQKSEWMLISSLSQVRKEVGGRFQNIRDRWVGAGFPLKEHRGSEKEPFKVNDEGWLEVTSWLLKQGYESRLVAEESKGYFEIRKHV